MGLFWAVLLAAVIPVRVTSVDGSQRDAELVGIDASGFVINQDGQVQTVSLDSLLSIERRQTGASVPAPIRVQLASGSRLAVTAMSMVGPDLKLSLRDQPEMIVPLSEVRWIRLRPSSPATDPQWLGMVETSRSNDSLVVRRAGESLDEVAGIVKTISATAITIDMEGDEVNAPLEKLEGVLFASSAREPESVGVIVDDVQGSRWQVVSLGVGGDGQLELNLSSKRKHLMPLDQVQRIELTGAVQFLAAEAPAERTTTTLQKIGLSPAIANQWLGVASEGNDLIMRSDSAIEFRSNDQFATLVGSVQFDPAVRAGGHCSARVLLDGKVVWDQTFDVEDPESRGFEIPLAKARRVRFEVRSSGDGDFGDTLRFRQPRLVK